MSESDAAAADRADFTLRQKITDEILAGETFPDIDDLRAGLPFAKGDFLHDVRTYLRSSMLDDGLDDAEKAALELALANPCAKTLSAAASAISYSGDLICRLELYAAWLGDDGCRDRTIRRAFDERLVTERRLDMQAYSLALGFGFAYRRGGRATLPTQNHVLALVASGMSKLKDIADIAQRVDAVLNGDPVSDDDAEAIGDAMQAADDLAAEVDDSIPHEYPAEPRAPGAIVMPPLKFNVGTAHQREIKKSWEGIAGERLPIVQVDDLAGSAARLRGRWPWAEQLIDIMLEDLSHGGDVVFRHTMIVGEPGTGKTALLRAIADEVGLPSQVYDLGGQADSSLMGTSARFTTAEEGVVLQLIKQERVATVGMIWDELEKVSEGKHNGSAQDALLPYLVPHQAERLRDPALNVEVDLSYVSHFATANSLGGVPAPLRDRFRVLRMASPTWQHLGLLTEQILDGIAERRGRDRGWYPPLAQDEIDNIKDRWSGGSIRRLERYVELTVAQRDKHQIFGRA